MHKEIDKKTTAPMLCSCKRRAVLCGGNHNTLQVIFIPGWQYQCVKSGRSRQARQLEEWCWCKVWDQRLLFKWNQRKRPVNRARGDLAWWFPCDGTERNIWKPASIKARPAGRSPVSFLSCFCQVCHAGSCLIAVHHFLGTARWGKKSMSLLLQPHAQLWAKPY